MATQQPHSSTAARGLLDQLHSYRASKRLDWSCEQFHRAISVQTRRPRGARYVRLLVVLLAAVLSAAGMLPRHALAGSSLNTGQRDGAQDAKPCAPQVGSEDSSGIG